MNRTSHSEASASNGTEDHAAAEAFLERRLALLLDTTLAQMLAAERRVRSDVRRLRPSRRAQPSRLRPRSPASRTGSLCPLRSAAAFAGGSARQTDPAGARRPRGAAEQRVGEHRRHQASLPRLCRGRLRAGSGRSRSTQPRSLPVRHQALGRQQGQPRARSQGEAEGRGTGRAGLAVGAGTDPHGLLHPHRDPRCLGRDRRCEVRDPDAVRLRAGSRHPRLCSSARGPAPRLCRAAAGRAGEAGARAGRGRRSKRRPGAHPMPLPMPTSTVQPWPGLGPTARPRPGPSTGNGGAAKESAGSSSVARDAVVARSIEHGSFGEPHGPVVGAHGTDAPAGTAAAADFTHPPEPTGPAGGAEDTRAEPAGIAPGTSIVRP